MQIDFDGNEIFLKIYYFHLYNIKNDIILLHVELLFEKLILHNWWYQLHVYDLDGNLYHLISQSKLTPT